MQMLIILLTICLLSSWKTEQPPKNTWMGLTPLHSTRKDVESIFGTSESKCNCLYRTAEGTVFIDYAVSPCSGELPGWNVPADTVLGFYVIPLSKKTLSEAGLELNSLVKTAGHDGSVLYCTPLIKLPQSES